MKKLFTLAFLCLFFFLDGQNENALLKRPVDTLQLMELVKNSIEESIELRNQKQFDSSLFILNKALINVEQTLGGKSEPYAELYYYTGNVLFHQRKFPDAESQYKVAIDIYEQLPSDKRIKYGNSVNNVGLCHVYTGRYSGAEKWFLRLKDIREEEEGKNSLNYASVLNNLGNLNWYLGKYEKVEALYLESLDIKAILHGKDSEEYVNTLGNLANLYWTLDQFGTAEEMYLTQLRILESIYGDNPENLRKPLENLANLYTDWGRFKKAEHYYKKIYTRQNTSEELDPKYLNALRNFGTFYLEIGNYEKAESIFQEVKKNQEALSDKNMHEYAITVSNLAMVYSARQEFEKAEKELIGVLGYRSQSQEDHLIEYGNLLNQIGNLYRKMGRPEQAEQKYREAIEVFAKGIGEDHSKIHQLRRNLGALYVETKQYEKARIELKKAEEGLKSIYSPNYEDHILVLFDQGILNMNLGKVSEAINYFKEVSGLDKERLMLQAEHLSENELSAFLRQFISRQNYFLKYSEAHPEFRGLAYDNELFYKGFLLNNSLHMGPYVQNDSTLNNLYNDYLAQQRLLLKEYARPLKEQRGVQKLEAEVESMEKSIVSKLSEFGESRRKVDWKEVALNLESDEAALEWVRYLDQETLEDYYAVLILKKDTEVPVFVKLCKKQELETLLKDSSSGKNRWKELYAYKEGEKSLHELLWGPIKSEVTDAKKLIIAPIGLIHKINLGAIHTPEGGKLIDRFHFQTVGSTRQVLQERESSIDPQTAVLYGGINYMADSMALIAHQEPNKLKVSKVKNLDFEMLDRDNRGTSFEYLPGTLKEVREIGELLEQSKIATKIYDQSIASEESIKRLGQDQPSPDILHLATHGYFYPDPIKSGYDKSLLEGVSAFKVSDHPLIRSGLIFAGGNHVWLGGKPIKEIEDGILTAYEVSQLDLRGTDLVVLSACETGLGDIQGHEGVYGLQRAFRKAGVKQLIMSLWSVPDQQTQEMMTLFYTQWLEEEKPISQAFRDTQLEMSKRHEDPYYWAGFVLVE